MPRRANHEGSFDVLPSGRVRGRVSLDGIAYSVTAPTKAAARDRLRGVIADHQRGISPPDRTMTVSDWLKVWLADYVTPLHYRPRTIASYGEIVEHHLEREFADIGLAKLRRQPELITRMLARKAAETRNGRRRYGPSTVRYMYTVLHIALDAAVRAKRLPDNPCDLIDAPPKGTTEIRPVDAERLIAAVTGTTNEALVRVFLSTGLRRGELLGLTWPAVDLDSRRLEVRAQWLDGELVEPKRDSRRAIDLPTDTVNALKTHRTAQKRQQIAAGGKWDAREFVFTAGNGKPIQPRRLARILAAALVSAGLEHSHPHALRHTFASMLLGEGEDIAIVSKLMGHRSIATTSDTYGHLTDQARSRAAERIGQALRRKAT